MKILVLGNSDTSGKFRPGPTWTQMVADGLRERLDSGVELVNHPFTIIDASSAAYAERRVREAEPDLVLLPFGTMTFSVPFVWKRVERRLGKRAGQWYRKAEASFDRGVREKGRLRDTIYRAAKRAAHLALGAEPLSTRERVTEGMRALIDAVARVENTQVVLIAAVSRGPQHEKPGARERRRAFLEEVRRAAGDRHFVFLDSDDAFPAEMTDLDVKNRDGLHQTSEAHRLLADFVLANLPASIGALA